MELFLQDKVVLVTGGAKGIGRAIVMLLAREGAIPVIVGRAASENIVTADEVSASGGKVFQVEAELTDPDQCEPAVKAIMARFGRIDGLVNNAGENDGVSLEAGSYQDFVSSLHKNLIHYYLMAHYCLPELKKSKGAIVNISSKVADVGQGGTSAYAAANGGRNALTREWAAELLPYEMRVNAVVVAECWTPLYERWIASMNDGQERLKAGDSDKSDHLIPG